MAYTWPIEPLSDTVEDRQRHPSTWCLPGMTWGWEPSPELHFDVRTSPDNINWTSWRNFTPGVELHCRYYQVRLRIKTDSPWVPFEIEKFKLVFDLPERFDAQRVLFQDESYKRVVFDEPFYTLDAAVATAEADYNAYIPSMDVVGLTVALSSTYSGYVDVLAAGV